MNVSLWGSRRSEKRRSMQFKYLCVCTVSERHRLHGNNVTTKFTVVRTDGPHSMSVDLLPIGSPANLFFSRRYLPRCPALTLGSIFSRA